MAPFPIVRRKATIDLIEQSGAVELGHQDGHALLRHAKRERQIGRRRELAAIIRRHAQARPRRNSSN
jgi:hypothetical protein